MSTAPRPERLVVLVVGDADADVLVRRMTERRYAVTRVGSTGGFLRHGNVTLLSGVPAEDVAALLALAAEICPERIEVVPVPSLPMGGEGVPSVTTMDVRIGGAVIFVLPIERFERF